MSGFDDRFRLTPGESPRLAQVEPDYTGGVDRSAARALLGDESRRLSELQERLYAESEQSLLLVLQAMDGGGKDSTIKGILSGINPQGCYVVNFKAPTAEELAHDFLWRVHRRVPPKGYIAVVNRSHYEEVLVRRVRGLLPASEIEARYEHINAFERLLHDHGTRLVKVFLNISKEYQFRRMKRRLQRPDKQSVGITSVEWTLVDLGRTRPGEESTCPQETTRPTHRSSGLRP